VKRETPAAMAVIRRLPGGTVQTVYACAGHVFRTIRELGGQDLEIGKADPAVHGCKGCLEDWTTP
jgi:hypothetical protein